MLIKTEIKFIAKFTIVAVGLLASLVFLAQPALAALPNGNGSGSSATPSSSECDKVNDSTQLKTCVHDNKIVVDLRNIINVLSVGVGIVVIGMIILGGIQYSIAGDNPQSTAAAKSRITNAFIALAIYLLLFAFLQWLIPGGLFG